MTLDYLSDKKKNYNTALIIPLAIIMKTKILYKFENSCRLYT